MAGQLVHKVFVYGTLKKGEPNFHLLENGANGTSKFLGVATLCERYPLVVATKYNIPFLLDKAGTGEVSFLQHYGISARTKNMVPHQSM